MLGLGVGLCAAGVLLLTAGSPQLPEEEIVAQARDFGMVFPDEVVPFNRETVGVEDVILKQAEKVNEPAPKQPSQPAPAGEIGAKREDTDNQPAAGKQGEADEDPVVERPDDAGEVEFTIPGGSTLAQVAKIIGAAGLADEEEFLTRAKERQVSQRIIADRYRLPADAGMDQIIDTIIGGH